MDVVSLVTGSVYRQSHCRRRAINEIPLIRRGHFCSKKVRKSFFVRKKFEKVRKSFCSKHVRKRCLFEKSSKRFLGKEKVRTSHSSNGCCPCLVYLTNRLGHDNFGSKEPFSFCSKNSVIIYFFGLYKLWHFLCYLLSKTGRFENGPKHFPLIFLPNLWTLKQH
jgi:hypothetical protein